jgi:hypothetical protein
MIMGGGVAVIVGTGAGAVMTDGVVIMGIMMAGGITGIPGIPALSWFSVWRESGSLRR